MARTSWPRAGSISDGAESCLHLPQRNAGTLSPILTLHALDATSKQAVQGGAFGDHPVALANDGHTVLAPDLDAPNYSWPSPAVMTRVTNAYNNLNALTGVTKVDIMAWSDGAAVALNWVKRNPTLVGRVWLWAPLTDLDWAYALAGYTPAYSTGGVTPQAGWPAEMDSLFGTGAAGQYGTSAGNGYRIRDEYTSWHGLGIPIHCVHATNDPTVPYQATQAFVTGVNDALVTVDLQSSGGHTNLFTVISTSQTVSFFRAWSN